MYLKCYVQKLACTVSIVQAIYGVPLLHYLCCTTIATLKRLRPCHTSQPRYTSSARPHLAFYAACSYVSSFSRSTPSAPISSSRCCRSRVSASTCRSHVASSYMPRCAAILGEACSMYLAFWYVPRCGYVGMRVIDSSAQVYFQSLSLPFLRLPYFTILHIVGSI